MAEDEQGHLNHLAGMLCPYKIDRVRDVLLDWLRGGLDEALRKRAAGANGTWRFVKDRHDHLVCTAPSLADHLAQVRAAPHSLLLTIESTGVSLYPFQVHPRSLDPLLKPDVANTRTFLTNPPKPLNHLVLMPWADVEGAERIRLWAGGGELNGNTMTWNWLVSLANDVPDIPAQATYPSRVRRRPRRDEDTEEHYDSLADD